MFLANNLSEKKYLSFINKIIKRYPQSPILLYYKGDYFKYKKSYDKALQIFERVVSLGPKIEEAHRSIANIYEAKGDYRRAILSYKRLQSLTADSDESYSALIRLYQKDKNLDQLCDEWLSIYSADLNNNILKEFLIEVLHKAGRIEEAKKIIQNK